MFSFRGGVSVLLRVIYGRAHSEGLLKIRVSRANVSALFHMTQTYCGESDFSVPHAIDQVHEILEPLSFVIIIRLRFAASVHNNKFICG